MIGIGLIIIGIVILLQAYGLLGSISGGVVWGIILIVIGIMFIIRRSARRKRRQAWMSRHRKSDLGVQEDESK